ncbi:response regulator transcription factor [Geminicoccus roseus]|uniref:response regulator transcription factor n=1 Tax=Geminicoccus roseus TaxID=404900 RepID=UPI0003F5554E|nr:response regulator transcription factor [Geminicoccus roseus]
MTDPTGSAQPGTVFVVDDDRAMRLALDSLFRSVGLQVELLDSTAEFLPRRKVTGPGCIVLDVRLPGTSGLDFQDQLRRDGIHLPVIFMTGHGDIPMSVRAMKAGAIDFLAKPFRDQDMLEAVAAAIERDRARLADETMLASLQAAYATLTPREREVMALVVTGLMNKQIAAEVGLQEITVKIHRGHMMKKMNARSLAELVRMADLLAPSRPGRPGI